MEIIIRAREFVAVNVIMGIRPPKVVAPWQRAGWIGLVWCTVG